MITLGLTGGVGMGKSQAAVFLREWDIPVAETDEMARELTRPGQPALEEIGRTFPGVLTGSGELDRRALAGIVFNDPAARQRLEAILHPRIRSAWLQRVGEWRKREETWGVVVIPLLFETGAEGLFDRVICVGCSRESQQERLRARGWSDSEIQGRVQAQCPVEEKMARSDVVVWTEGSLRVHREQLRRVVFGSG